MTAPETKTRDRPRVVIVGGGFGGLAAARALRRARADVVLFDRRNHHVFQPLLYQVATAALSPANIAAPIRKVLGRQANCQVFMGEVTAVDVAGRQVIVNGEPYGYDYLILATGVETNYFGRDDWQPLAPGLKTIDEAINVRGRFLIAFEQAETETDSAARRAALTFAIVGAGPTGVEMAGAIAEISRNTLRNDFRHFDTDSVRVILIDAQDRILPTFDTGLSQRAHSDLEKLGVEIMTNTRVTEVEKSGLTVLRNDATERIGANNIVWAAGVKASPLGAATAEETDRMGRVNVEPDLAIPGHSEVFAIGDLANSVDRQSGKAVPGVAQGAIQMGRFAGKTIAREIAAVSRGKAPPGRGEFAYNDKGSMATIGRNRAVADIKGFRFGGALAFLTWAFIHVLFLIDFRHKVVTLAEWIWMYFFHERGVRLITGEGNIPRRVKAPRDDDRN